MTKLKFFKFSEFECKCGCGLNNFSHTLAAIIDEMREACGFPFVVRSACRCKPHNKKEGGKRTSDHLTGEGVDIRARNTYEKFMIIQAAIFMGIKRLGEGNSFVHVGIRKSNPQERFWNYR